MLFKEYIALTESEDVLTTAELLDVVLNSKVSKIIIPFKSAIKGYQEQEGEKISKWTNKDIRGLLRYFKAVEDKDDDYTGQLNALFLKPKNDNHENTGWKDFRFLK